MRIGKYPKAVAKIVEDLDVLLELYTYPAEHWIHLRTTNPIESTFATVRLRTKSTKGPGSRAAAIAVAYKLIDAAQAAGARSTPRIWSPWSVLEPSSTKANSSNAPSTSPHRTRATPQALAERRSPETPDLRVLTSRSFKDRISTVDDQIIGDAVSGDFVTETFDYDGGRQVTVYVPPDPPEAVVFAGDGQLIPRWGALLEAVDLPSTMIVGVYRLADETLRLREYSPRFDPDRFVAHERFFVENVRRWTGSRFGVALPTERTAVFGVSAGGELALALGLRHPDVYGAVFCASPGAGYQPPSVMPSSLPRAYLVAGKLEPFFLENATRWADALRGAGADVVMSERVGSHGDAFWREELPLMVAWAFGR